MTAYSSPGYLAKLPGASPAGLAKTTQRLHDTCAVGAPALNDVVYFGYLPRNAIVSGVTLKAATQLDSNGSPTLTYDVGYAAAGTYTVAAQAFMAASALVGHAAGASFDTTMVASGKFFQNLSGADLPIIVTAHAAAATGVAGTLELMIDYWIEPTVGSPA